MGLLMGCFNWVKLASICKVHLSSKAIKPPGQVLKGFCDLYVVVFSNERGLIIMIEILLEYLSKPGYDDDKRRLRIHKAAC